MSPEPGQRGELLVVDDEAITLPRGLDPSAIYDVVINGRLVWSLQPERDTRNAHPGAVAEWPKAMRRYLDGQAQVELRDHLSDETLASAEVVFADNSSRRVSVTDDAGRPLFLDKWGRLIRPLSGEDDSHLDELMDEVVRLLDVMREQAGVPAYICYGTLLGAVRDGRLIGHDNDIDLAYVSEWPDPVDVIREGYHVERVLKDAGWVVRRGSGVRLNVRLRMTDGSYRFVDVFTSHWVEGVFYIPSDTGFRLPRETILPLRDIELMGRQVPAPADPGTLLEATYGAGWRVPDPSFKYQTPRWLGRRLGGWFGGLMTHRKHWDSFDSKQRKLVPRGPSAFARWVMQEYPSSRPLVDLGTGTGRDARWFARAHGRRVVGVDYSVSAVARNTRFSERHQLPASFELINLYDSRAVLGLGARLSREPEPVDVYARFTLHDLEPEGREMVLRLASMCLRRGGRLFLEFRTPDDIGRHHVFGEHPRMYLDPDDVVAQIHRAGGRVIDRQEGTGLAVLREEDAHVCRLVASWEDGPTAEEDVHADQLPWSSTAGTRPPGTGQGRGAPRKDQMRRLLPTRRADESPPENAAPAKRASAEVTRVRARLRETRRELRETRRDLEKARDQIREGRVELPQQVEEVIARVRREKLTFLHTANIRDLAALVRDLDQREVPGLVIEAGTALGGSAIVMAAAKEPSRPMKVYDVFGMIPPPSEHDGKDVHRRYDKIAAGDAKGRGGEVYYGYRSDLLTEVTESFERLGVPVGPHHVELVPGLFQDTIDLDEPVAFAHLDGDWYESTMTCLTRIAPLISPGGRIVLDDYYAWSGCRTAVDEYFADRDDFELRYRSRVHAVRRA